MNWTKEQKATIETRGKNILVAAAAGSGKTTVLVERILHMIMEDSVPVDSMLIVTFTRAAAAELKEKIQRALKKRQEGGAEIGDQLERLSRAQISTFHAFSMEVVRQFFYLTELEPDFAICDEAQKTLLMKEAVEEVFRESFEADDRGFITLLDWYSGEKNTDSFKEMIVKLYDILMALPDPFVELDRMIGELEDYSHSRAWSYFDNMLVAKLRKAEAITERVGKFLADNGLFRLEEIYRREIEAHQHFVALAEKGDKLALKEALNAFSTVTLKTRGEEEKEAYAQIKDLVTKCRKRAKAIRDELKDKYLNESLEAQVEEMASLKPVAQGLRDLLFALHSRFREKKLEKNKIDFNDIEHYCLQILQNQDAREFYKKRFCYLFVDEYQDTSVMQETILEAIAGEGNTFMVGDIKQSIYKFRLAEPEIFQERYDRYGSGAENSVRIDLNRNYRSKPAILRWINERFSSLMDRYDEAASLKPGIDTCSPEYDFCPQVRILRTKDLKDHPDKAIREMQKDEMEAHLVCDIIQENLGQPFQDSKAPGGPKVRPLHYRDMALLMRNSSGKAGIYQDVLQRRGIPVFVEGDKGYFDTIEVNVVMNLLSVLDNRYRDIPFLSVLRSEIFHFTSGQLADVRLLEPKGSYVEAFMGVAEREVTGEDAALVARAREVLGKLEQWRALSITMPLPEFVWLLLRESGYYLLAGAMPRGDIRQANLRKLLELTVSFGQSGQGSLYGFVKYVESIKKDKKVDIGQMKLLSENDDVVRMMTIHKSKGLEFPMVILAGTGNSLKYSDAKQKVYVHKDLGLGMFLEDPEEELEKRSLGFKLLLEKLNQEEFDEEKRLLYVAMTRARDKLFLTGCEKEPERLLDKKDVGDVSKSTYLSMMPSLDDVRIVEPEEVAAPKEVENNIPEVIPGEGEDFGVIVQSRLSYVYPYGKAAGIRSRYSVSALNAEARRPQVEMGEAEDRETLSTEREEEYSVPLFLQPERKLSGAERGTLYHRIMQEIDPRRAEQEGLTYLRGELEKMVRSEIMFSFEAEAVNLREIHAFFQTDLGHRYAQAGVRGELFREQSFVMTMERSGEQSSVQGVIDAFFREGDRLVLLDYKTNWVDPGKPFEDEAGRIRDMYKEQQAIYGRALEQATGLPVVERWLYLFSAGEAIQY